MLAVSLLAGAAVVGGAMPWRRRIVRWLSGLVEWESDRGRLTIGRPASLAMLTVGVMSLSLIGHVVSLGGGIPAPTTPTASYDPPNQPTVQTVSPDTNSVIIIGSAFEGDGDDTQDSVQVQVFRVANDMSGAAMLSGIQGAFTRDTLTSNDSLKADTTYKARIRYKGAAAKSAAWSAWSAPDTFVNSIAVGPDSVFFFSDWRNGTGTGDPARFDGGKWEQWLAGTTTIDATPACSGFPSGLNVLSITGSSGALWVQNYRSTPAVGDSIGVRFYACVISNPDGDGTHGIYFTNGTNPWGPQALGWFESASGGTWDLMLSVGAHQDPFNTRYFTPDELSTSTVYRIEALYIRSGTNTYQIRARYYSASGTLLFGEEDFPPDPGWADPTGPDLHLRTFTNSAAAGSMTGFTIGANGGPVAEYAAVAICSSWCGAYPIAGVED